ncbi:DUF1801 domain-containing protein [uncultured Aquimarina sp.]|uniref:DUF1801 domain-containing protein n=1 Tax=uncultured Aquimarina sp. TaxID=575652 RepID=UPI00261E3661|nr:DUF1801 domain-containing protein [uncultured Aquimarina sp.]
MTKNQQNKIHPDFLRFLELKEQNLIELYKDLRAFIMDLYPDTNELLYHTHALTSLYSISEKMSDGFCMIPIYNNHLNLGFNKGTLLTDKHNLLTGTGKLIRHIPVKEIRDYRNDKVKDLVKLAIDFAIEDMGKPTKSIGQTISKIKTNTK